jgi:hypothetical protein
MKFSNAIRLFNFIVFFFYDNKNIMGGGLMQLGAYGAQDIYLTGNPQITFFKVVYRRHTNFSMETIEQTIKGSSQCAVGGGTSGTVTISRNGDLVYKVYVTSDTTGIDRGDLIVNEVELEIGGQMIDRQYEEWNHVWNELTTPASKQVGLKAMTNSAHYNVGSSTGDSTAELGMVQIPLNFWFCRNPGLALPLIALQYHEVKMKFKWGDGGVSSYDASNDILTEKVGSTASCKVFCDYIYLDTDERRRFAQVSHEYLIEQIQKQAASNSKNTKLNFNHPVKELIWTTPSTNVYVNAKLVLNGHDRFSEQREEYFQLRQPYDYHTAVPHCNLPAVHHPSGNVDDFITKNDYVVHTDGKGLDSVAMDNASLTWVKLAGHTPGSLPAATVSITNASTDAHGFIVGALSSVSSIIANSLKVGSTHGVALYDDSEGTTAHTLGAKVSHILLSNLGTVDTKAETSGILGPLHFADSGATENYLVAGSATDDITDATGGGILVLYDTLITFGFTLESGVDYALIRTTVANVGTGQEPTEAATSLYTRRINVYSFALKPEEHQPSGTCNFSRIDNAQLQMNTAPGSKNGVGMNIYAVNYNVLRIMSGMGGLAYSN